MLCQVNVSSTSLTALSSQNTFWCFCHSVRIITPVFGPYLSSGSTTFCLVYRFYWTFWSFSSFSMAPQPLVGQGLLIVDASLSRSVRHTTLCRTPLDEWSARRGDRYLTTHNTHKRHPCPRRYSNPQSQYLSVSQTHALDSATIGIGSDVFVGNVRDL